MSSVTPCTMNIDARVTTIDCMRRKAMKKPLNAPTMPPITMAPMPQTIWDPTVSFIVEANIAFTSEITVQLIGE